MKQADSPTPRARPRKIVGFSLSPEMAADAKMEAARRNISLRKLFADMWALFKDNKPA